MRPINDGAIAVERITMLIIVIVMNEIQYHPRSASLFPLLSFFVHFSLISYFTLLFFGNYCQSLMMLTLSSLLFALF